MRLILKMNGRLPPIHALVAFESVARNKSFSKAAEELCITRGAVSHRITLLETHLGVPVVERATHQAALTHAGMVYLQAVTEALALLNNATHAILDQRQHQHLKVNALPAFAGNWLIERLSYFQSRYPNIEIEIDPLTYALSQFGSMELDVAVRYGLGTAPDLRGIKLQDIRLYPVCSPDYLSRTGPVMRPADLLQKRLLGHRADPWNVWFQAAGVFAEMPKPAAIFGDARLLLDAAIDGQGIALARDLLTRKALESGMLVRLFDIDAVSPRSYFAFIKPNPRAEVDDFVNWLLADGMQRPE